MWWLYHPYALRLHFRLYADQIDAPLIFGLDGCIHGSCVELSGDTVKYKVVVHDARTNRYNRYDVWARYEPATRNVHAISAFCYTYCRDEQCWRQRIDEDDYTAFESVHAHIRDQLQHHFHIIDSGWTAADPDATECPWMFSQMVAFHQACTPDTRTRIRRFVDRMRRCRQWRLRARRIMKYRAFSKWKEWYYDPDNAEGYVKRLRNKDAGGFQNSMFV